MVRSRMKVVGKIISEILFVWIQRHTRRLYINNEMNSKDLVEHFKSIKVIKEYMHMFQSITLTFQRIQ